MERESDLLQIVADLKAYRGTIGSDDFKSEADFIRYLSAVLDACTDGEVSVCRRWLGGLERRMPPVSAFVSMLEGIVENQKQSP